MRTNRQEQIEQVTREFLADPNKWPNWPYLPMKKYPKGGVGNSVLGIVVEGVDLKSVVYETNLFSLPKTPEGWVALPKHEYITLQALMNDGWIVD
jgi:hypothetical protein